MRELTKVLSDWFGVQFFTMGTGKYITVGYKKNNKLIKAKIIRRSNEI